MFKLVQKKSLGKRLWRQRLRFKDQDQGRALGGKPEKLTFKKGFVDMKGDAG